MAWFKVDDALHSHPKARAAGLKAMGLWVEAGSHAAQYLTDGRVPEWYVRSWPGGVAAARELVSAGLWEQDSDGWRFRDWDDYQPTREEVEADREQARERQRRFRQARREAKNKAQDKSTERAIEAMRNGVTTGVTDAVTNDVSHDPPYPSRPVTDPTRPLSSSSHLGNGGGSSVPRETATTPEVQPCGSRHDAARPCGGCKRANERAAEAERKERARAATTAAKVRAREAQDAIDACDLCGPDGRLKSGRVCAHVESAPMPESLRGLGKAKEATE